MTNPLNTPSTGTPDLGGPIDREPATTTAPHVSGGDADRMDPAGPGTGGMQAGADGETAAREQLRKDLGERRQDAGTDDGDDIEQDAALGETDDPHGGSIQEHGSNPSP